MYRIRLHGRGGQGVKTGAHLLGTTLFLSGYEVQDAPRYGAERRGAPIFAYVRAGTNPINERGVIPRPELIVVADDTLLTVSAGPVLEGAGDGCVLLVHSAQDADHWRRQLSVPAAVLVLPPYREQAGAGVPVGAYCAGAAAGLIEGIEPQALERAVTEELAGFGEALIERNRRCVLAGFQAMASHQGLVRPGEPLAVADTPPPDWIAVPADPVGMAAPVIHAGATSRRVRTGLWRTRRPVIDRDRCRRCLLCRACCPDGCIGVDEEGLPVIDYQHCKGCLVCAALCPAQAISALTEERAGEDEDEETADRQ
jgi:pyruvate ferredoxin oxidoreductase gamma subunit